MLIANGMGVAVGGRGVDVGGIGVGDAKIAGMFGVPSEQAVIVSNNNKLRVRFSVAIPTIIPDTAQPMTYDCLHNCKYNIATKPGNDK